MLITLQSQDQRCQLQLKGRLDANWAEHVAKALEAAIRDGYHEVDLDFSDVSYISSAGIRVLLKYSRQLKAARGVLRVVRPIDSVSSVLQLSGLTAILLRQVSPVDTLPPQSPKQLVQETMLRRWHRDGSEFEAYEIAAASPLDVELVGRPEALAGGQLSAAQSHRLRCTADVVAVGLGAFGLRGDDGQARFGEAMAVVGTAVTLPTDGSSVPDYQVTEGELVPELHLLYGVTARGAFSRLIRFEASRSDRRGICLGALVEAVLQDLQSAAAGFAILAESASVVGAMLKRSPVLANGQPLFLFPAVRDWLTFTTERTDEKNLVLITGVAAREPQGEVASCLRPIGPGTGAQGHFHAAVFPYRPLPKGKLELKEAVDSVLGTESATVVMHLLADEREFEGVGQTDLMRGACWAGPLRLQGVFPENHV